ncbi:hypothetical protein ACROYT_G004405 [Oculina patagonica]
MASLLSLNNDCLHRIVSCLDDPPSFYSIALSCKRLLQVTKSTRNVIHSKLLRSKAMFYIKSYLVDIVARGLSSGKYYKLGDLLEGAARLTEAKGILSYDKMIDTWQKNGPVVAKLFTWIRYQEGAEREGWPRATCITNYGRVTLHLPSCNKDMVIETTYFRDYMSYIGNYDNELSIHVTCGDIHVTSGGFTRYCPEDLLYWEEEAIPAAAKPMRPVIELLQKELGDTSSPITDLFFVWLCFFFAGGNNLLEEHPLHQHTPGSVQAAVDLFDQDLRTEAKSKFQDLVFIWKIDAEQELSHFSENILETIHLLSQRSETKFLKKIQEDAGRFYQIASDYELKKLPKQLLLDLILRTSLEESSYSPGSISDKFVHGRVSFRSLGGKVIKLWGGMHGDGVSYPSWYQLQLEFTLPDGKELKLDTGYLGYRNEKRPCLPIEELSPVTDLLQQGIDDRMQGEKIPKIDNMFTATYFLHTLQFSEAEKTFLG